MFSQNAVEENHKDFRNTPFGEASQLSQSATDSQNSQLDVYSQSLVRANSDVLSDYWSQSSSQQHEENIRSYVSRPLLFGLRNKHVAQRKTTGGTHKQFVDMQQKKGIDSHQRMVLDNFVNLLKEYSAEVKSSLESIKTKFDEDMKTNTEIIKSSCNSEEIVMKVNETFVKSFEDTRLKQESDEVLKERISDQSKDLLVKDEIIKNLKSQIDDLQITIKTFTKKDNQYYKIQEERLQQILQQLCNNEIKDNETSKKISQNLQSILHQNHEFQQNLNNISNNQGTCFQTICEIQQKLNTTRHLQPPNQTQQNNINPTGNNSQPPFVPYLSSLPGNSCHEGATTTYQSFDYHLSHMNQQNQKAPAARINLPIKPLSHFSPLPLGNKHHLMNIACQPSPTAIVAPTIRNRNTSSVKNEPIKKNCVYQSNEVLELSSSSESAHDITDVVEKFVNKQKQQQQQQLCFTPTTKELLNTSSDYSKKTSTPVQRSIRRYGKIKKRVSPFSPVLKGDNDLFMKTAKSLNKPLNEVVTKQHSTRDTKQKHQSRSTRGNLAMKRKQENVFNFEGGEGLNEITQLLRRTHKSQKTRR